MAFERGLRVGELLIPESELDWSFDPSGGPGGQHANRSSTRVTLAFDISGSIAFSEPMRTRLLERLGTRARDGAMTVTCDETRSQWRNRAIARQRLIELLTGAMTPTRTRRKTKPSRSARRRRLTEKRHRGETKRLRRRPSPED